MYSEKDYSEARKAMIIRIVIGSLLIAAIAAALIVFTRMRMLAVSMIVCCVLFCVTFFYWSVKLMPHIRYNIFLRDIRQGRRRETECSFVSFSEGVVIRDGVQVHEMIVRVDDTEDGERLFYWDDDKARPDYAEGQALKIESFGNYIVSCVG